MLPVARTSGDLQKGNMSKSLPVRPSLIQLKRRAKDFLRQLRRRDEAALERLQAVLPEFGQQTADTLSTAGFALNDAQRVIAREYGFRSWTKLKQHVEAITGPVRGNSHVALLSHFYENLVESLSDDTPIIAIMTAMSEAMLEAHQEKAPWVFVVLSNWSPTLVGKSEDQIFATGLDSEDCRDAVAPYFGFRSWEAIGGQGGIRLDPEFELAAEAVIAGELSLLKQILASNSNLVQERSRWGHRCTLLHYVAANGTEIHRQSVPENAVAMARYLLESGADPNALAETYGGGVNQTPLCLLITSGHPHAMGLVEQLVEVLAGFGAHLNGVDESGAPLKMALDFGYTETAGALVQLGADLLNVESAAGVGSFEDLERHLGQNPGAEQLDKALYLAARNGHLNCIQTIVDAGADVDTRGWFGGPALHWAALNGYDGIVRGLVAAGADPNLRDTQFGAHAAGWANEGGHGRLRDWLLENGCRISITEAAAFGRIDLVKGFLSDPLSVNASEGRSPLHEAAGRGNLELMELLLSEGADPNARDDDGLSPLDWAHRAQCEQAVVMLSKVLKDVER